MSGAANIERGEASLTIGGVTIVLRPSFAALVRAEAELGSLFALVEKAAGGGLSLSEIAGLFWHCLEEPGSVPREKLGEALIELGLAVVTPVLRTLLQQILKGR